MARAWQWDLKKSLTPTANPLASHVFSRMPTVDTPAAVTDRFWGKLARWTGLEPATPGVTGRYSNQLSYHRALWGGIDASPGGVNGGSAGFSRI